MTPTSGSGARLSPRIGPVRVRRAPEVYADALRDRILSESIPPGALLPAERDLADESGLSRAAVREALGMLSVEGLLTSKVGRGGGYVVQQPPPDGVVRFMDVFIRGRRIDTTSLLEVRDVVEPRCAELAARRASDADVVRLERLTAHMAELVTDVPRFLDRNVEWHVAIAEIGGNDVLAAVMTAISANIRAAIAADEYGSPVTLAKAHALHEKILDAIRRRDPETAGRLMRRHLQAASSALHE